MKKILIIAAMLVLSVSAQADTLHDLTVKAIQQGKSQGFMKADELPFFAAGTKSNKPIEITMERVQVYSQTCAELLVTAHQSGVPTSLNKNDPAAAVFNMTFKVPFCTDGSVPIQVKNEMLARQHAAIAACVHPIKNRRTFDGIETASIEFANCPKEGTLGIHYSGTCAELKPGPKATVKEFQFSKTGSLSVNIFVPKSCADGKTKNSWTVYIHEHIYKNMPPVHIGTTTIDFEAK